MNDDGLKGEYWNPFYCNVERLCHSLWYQTSTTENGLKEPL